MVAVLNRSRALLLESILPGIAYDNGFLVNGKILPFYSFSSPDGDAHWSDEMSDFLEESSRDHFIDIYNRRIAVNCLSEKLSLPGATFADFGCSSGYLLEDVNKSFPSTEMIGADFISAALSHCHKRLPHIPIFQADLVHCPFPENTFDSIACLNVLEHIEQDGMAISQLARILKPNGQLVITVPVGHNLYDLYDEIHYHVRRYDLNDLKAKVRNSGLHIIRANYFGVFIYPLFYMVKKLNKLRYDKLPFEEKKRKAVQQAKVAKRSFLMERLCLWEELLGRKTTYPIGIRGYIYAFKTAKL